MTEAEQAVMSGMIDLLDDLMTAVPRHEVVEDYNRLRREGMKLTGQA